jgi:hypothetical protein
LEFVLDPKNARVLKMSYHKAAPVDCLGLASSRLLFMTVPRLKEKAKKDRTRNPESIRDLFAKRHIFADYVRTENLGGDLYAFLRHHAHRLRFRAPLTTAEDLIARIPVKNASDKTDGLSVETVPHDLRQRVREREWLLYEAFGYDVHPKGRPPECLSAVSLAARYGRALPDPGRYQESDRDQGARFAIASEQPQAFPGVVDIE